MSAQPVRLLCIDGGGIRGLIPALLLTAIEALTERSIVDLFDVIVGTSTGGILALGLTVPDENRRPAFDAADLSALYPEWGKKIFPGGGAPTLRERLLGRGETWAERMGNAGRRVGGPWGGNPLFGGAAKHSSSGLEQVLDHYFGQIQMADALRDVAVTSFDTSHGVPFVFTRREARQRPEMNVPMRVAARATSAAPTFLPPEQTQIGTELINLIDGGVWANNPIVVGYLEALSLTVERRITADSIYVVSLGTGTTAPGGGRFGISANWLSTFKDLAAMATDTNTNEALMRWQFAFSPERYWRFQSFAASAVGSMDDPTPQRIDELTNAAFELILERKSEFQELARLLVTLASPQQSLADRALEILRQGGHNV